MPDIPPQVLAVARDACRQALATRTRTSPMFAERVAHDIAAAVYPVIAAAERARIVALADAWKCSCGEDHCTAVDGVRDFADQLAAQDAGAPSPVTGDGDEQPCEGFRWIGQPWTSCDTCGRPAWEHAGMEVLADDAQPFGVPKFETRPWRPGHAEALREKWGGGDA